MAKKGLTKYEFYVVTRDGDLLSSFGQLPQAQWHVDIYDSLNPGHVHEIHSVEVSLLGWPARGEVAVWVNLVL